MRGEYDDDDDRGNADEPGDVDALGVPKRMAVNGAWCWLALVVITTTGCTLLRWGDNPGNLDNVTPTITVLKFDVPTVNVTFGWSDGTFLLRNGGIIAGLSGAAVTVVVVLCVMALRASRTTDRKS